MPFMFAYAPLGFSVICPTSFPSIFIGCSIHAMQKRPRPSRKNSREWRPSEDRIASVPTESRGKCCGSGHPFCRAPQTFLNSRCVLTSLLTILPARRSVAKPTWITVSEIRSCAGAGPRPLGLCRFYQRGRDYWCPRSIAETWINVATTCVKSV